MKMTRKLIPAFVMLLVSAIMLSTASFAWFASNRDVKAESMTVKANVVTQFLQISNAQGGEYSTVASPANNNAKTLDLVHAEIENGNSVKWYTGTSKDHLTGAKDGELSLVDTTQSNALDNYVLLNTFWFKMYETSNDNLSDLVVKSVTITSGEGDKFAKALRVLVVGEGGVAEIWSNTSGEFKRVGEETVLLSTVTKTAQSVDVYVYYDGEDASANTSNAIDLGNITVSVSFVTD